MKKLLFVLALTGCNFLDEPHYDVDPRLKPYVDQFFIEAESRGHYIKPYALFAVIEDLDGINGHARYTLNSNNYIYIDRGYYDENITQIKNYPHFKVYFERQIEIVVFHELGHSLLGLEHNKDGYSIMCLPDYRHSNKYGDEDEVRKLMIDNLFK